MPSRDSSSTSRELQMVFRLVVSMGELLERDELAATRRPFQGGEANGRSGTVTTSSRSWRKWLRIRAAASASSTSRLYRKYPESSPDWERKRFMSRRTLPLVIGRRVTERSEKGCSAD